MALDTLKSRRAAALAIAARSLHAVPELDEADWHHKVKCAHHKRATSRDAQREGEAKYASASKLLYPDSVTRGINYKTTRHPNPRSGRGGEAPLTKAYRGRDIRQSVTHVNPVETDKDFKAGAGEAGFGAYIGGKNKQRYGKNKQCGRNVANAEKILGINGKEGYGYSTGRAIPHILAKIDAYADEDKKAWTEDEKRAFDRKWKAKMDAKAQRVYGKTQFAGNDEDNDQYDTLSTMADSVASDYRKVLLSAAKGHSEIEADSVSYEYKELLSDAKKHSKIGLKDEIAAHDAMVKHYKALAQAKKFNYKYKQSDELKHYRELNQYKTDYARGHRIGDTINMGMKWRKKENGGYEVTDEPDFRVMEKKPVQKKKRKALNLSAKRRAKQYAASTTPSYAADGIGYFSFCLNDAWGFIGGGAAEMRFCL
ncbi:hypothetical protein R80B4_01097 [Fibrobacteres bacterium R8-0-B4]